MKKIRVLHVFRNMNLGGSQAFVMNIYNKINRERVQFDFLVSEDGAYDKEIQSLGGKIYKIPYLTQVGQKKYSKELKNFFLEHKDYNIVHSHLNQISGIVLEAAKKAGIKNRIAHSHSTNNRNNLIVRLYKQYLQGKINGNATKLFACSEKAAKWLYKSKYKEAKIINNGIDLKKYDFSEEKRKRIRKELNIEKDIIVIGHVGRLDHAKNHLFLLDIFYQYLNLNPKSILLLVGDGDNKKRIEEKAEKLGIGNKIIFIGAKKAIDYYNAMDIFVFPSLYEGFGMVLIEAQASGLYCLSSDRVPKETNATGKCYFMSLEKNEKEWAKKIEETINLSKNEKRKNTVPSDKYDIEVVAEELENLYISLDRR